MTTLAVSVFLALASWRVEHLLTADLILARPRTVAVARLPRMLGALLTCSACMGVWCAAAVLAVAWLLGWHVGGWRMLLWVPAVAGGQLMLAAVEKRLAR